MDYLDSGLPSNSKRKAVDSLASSDSKKPRLSLAARFPTISSQPMARNLSTQFNRNSRFGGAKIPTRKGKEKATTSYREISEELPASGSTLSSINRRSFPKDSQSVFRAGSNLSKGKSTHLNEKYTFVSSSSASNSTSGSSRARPSSWSQRKTNLQDPISISSDSDEENEQNIPIKKGKRMWQNKRQMDIVDLTLDDGDDVDEITVIEMKKRSPNCTKNRRSLGHRVKKTESFRKSNVFDDERTLPTEAPSPTTILPTPPKSENDEPEFSAEDITKQRPKKLASINGSNKIQPWRDDNKLRHSLFRDAEVIDLCTDESSEELQGELLGTDGLLPSLGDNTEDAYNTTDTVLPSSSGLIDQNHFLSSPGFGDFNDQLPGESLGIDGQLLSIMDNTENAHDTMGIVPLTSSYENRLSPLPDVGDLSSHGLPHELPSEPSDGQPPASSVEANTENVHDAMDIVSLELVDRNHLQPSPDVADFSDKSPNEPLNANGQSSSLKANTGNARDAADNVPLLSSGSIGTGVGDFSDELINQSLGIDGQLASVGANAENAHSTMDIVPLELIDHISPSVADFSNRLPDETLGVDGGLLSLEANTENTQDTAVTVPSLSSGLIDADVGDFSDGCLDGQVPSETNTENTRDMDIVPLSSSDPSPSPGVGEPVISNAFVDPMEALLDPISELEISPLLNSHEEEEVLRNVLLEEDGLIYEEEEMLVEIAVPATDTPPDESFSNSEKDNSDKKHTPRLADTRDNGFSHGNLVKEPDFSKISTEATEPVPDYDDRLNAAIKWPAEKFPTELHDMINALPTNYLYNPQMRHVFEAMIEDNTAADEPKAPKIRIIGRKNGPVTPPWEFYYTNRIVNGEGVPRSDKKLLQGCDCIGPCDPKSKTCACVQRQMAWTGGDIKGFLYKKERLLHPHYPVFECNDACECSEECTNRVIQHGRKHPLSVTLTKNKGWGVFADEKIPRGSYLGIYAGEMILEAEADERGQLYDRYGRTYLFDLDFYHLRALGKGKDKERDTNTYTIDAFHVGNFTRFLNHSCDPNCQITPTYVNEPDLHKPALTIFTSRDVQRGEELTFSYLGEADSEETDEEEEENMIKVEAGPSSRKQQAVHRRCLCGAANCRGQMF